MKKIISPEKIAPVPTLAASVRELVEAGRLDEVDNIVLEKLEQSPSDLPFILAILRTLVNRKLFERAEVLFQIITDTLQKDDSGKTLIDFYVSLLKFWPQHEQSRCFLIDHLHSSYGNSPRFQQFITITNVRTADDPLCALQALERWLRCDIGRLVFAARKGAGIVADINIALGIVRVKLHHNSAGEVMSMRIAETERQLIVLACDDLFYEMIVNPEGIRRIVQENPGEILRRLFDFFQGSLTLTEIKDYLTPIVGEEEWPVWWKRAKEDRRLTVGVGPRSAYNWRESVADAENSLISHFTSSSLRERLKLARVYSQRHPELVQTMGKNLFEAAIRESDPALAFETALTLKKHLGFGDADIAPSIERILKEHNVAQTIARIADRTLLRLSLTIVKERCANWERIYLDLLMLLDDASIISTVYETLIAGPSRDQLLRVISSVIALPESAPALYAWIGSEMPRRSELAPFANCDYVAGLFGAIANDKLKSVHTALRRLFDGGGPVDMAIKKLDLEGAQRLLAILQRDTRLESYRRQQLICFIERRFPEATSNKKDFFLVTAQALTEKRAEYERIVNVEIPKNALEIKRTREYGDLRENFEYHAARSRHEILSSRAKELLNDLALARALDPATIDTSAVNVGTRVVLKPEDPAEKEVEIVILGPWDSDPAKNIFSYRAPAVKEMLGARPGDCIEFNGKPFRIHTINLWQECRS